MNRPDQRARESIRALIVLPTHNEAGNLEDLVREVLDLEDRADVLVIDDDSRDGTREIARRLVADRRDRVFLCERPAKLGYGSACMEGFRVASRLGYNAVLEMDADRSHDPAHVPQFLDALRDHDLVVGSRYLHGVRIPGWPRSRLILSRSANAYVRVMTGLKLRDCTGGYNGFSRRALETLPLPSFSSVGFGFILEAKFWAQRLGLRIREIPIVFRNRRSGASKLSPGIAHEAFLVVLRLFLLRWNSNAHTGGGAAGRVP